MPAHLHGESTGAGAALPRRAVVVIGVVGLSAAGKSTVAHRLAEHLHSPLHPIPLDDFFIPAACERLGTFDDCRVVDHERMVRAVGTLRSILSRATPTEGGEGHDDCVGGKSHCEGGSGGSSSSGAPADGAGKGDGVKARRDPPRWERELVEALPAFHRYIVRPPAGEESAKGEEARSGREGEGDRCTQPLSDSLAAAADDASVGSDFSLRAHEEEEEDLRARREPPPHPPTLQQQQLSPERLVAGAALPPIFVVCEGFCLFASRAAADSGVFDGCVRVECGANVACSRRFRRTPRRHRQGQGYRGRIELMWETRTEERRQGLLAALEEAMSPPRGGEQRDGGDGWRELLKKPLPPPPATATEESESPAAAAMGRWLRDGAAAFFPPLSPSSAAGAVGQPAPVLWDAASDNAPTEAFVDLWRRCGSTTTTHHASSRTGETADEDIDHDDDVCSSFLAALAAVPHEEEEMEEGEENTAGGDAAAAAHEQQLQLRRRYCEFRFWYFYEVVFYYFLLLPLQRRNMRRLLHCRDDSTGAGGFSAVIHNGASVGRAEMEAEVRKVAAQVRSTTGSRFQIPPPLPPPPPPLPFSSVSSTVE